MSDVVKDLDNVPSNPAGEVRLTIKNSVAAIEFDRPKARNAMTWTMYEDLANACDTISNDASVRVVTLRGVGGKAFISGTDIEQFLVFNNGDDGVEYEKQVEKFVSRVENLTVPTIAIVEGWAVGGGLAIANACDFRIATPGAKFGVPIAKTLGNCLSAKNLHRLAETLGVAIVKRMLLLADFITAEELQALGYVLEVVPPSDLNNTLDVLCDRIASHAPITMRVTKQALLRQSAQFNVKDDDLIRECYGSDDFKHGVESFVGKKLPKWTGR